MIGYCCWIKKIVHQVDCKKSLFCCLGYTVSFNLWAVDFAKELPSHCTTTWYSGLPCCNMCGMCVYSTGHAFIRFQQNTLVSKLDLIMLHWLPAACFSSNWVIWCTECYTKLQVAFCIGILGNAHNWKDKLRYFHKQIAKIQRYILAWQSIMSKLSANSSH
jgi:hypothetical protein